jgi:hypothetical protein
MPLSLSDDELAALMTAARPIPPRDRDQFLRDVAVELAKYPEVGPGIIGRVCSKLQRQHLNSSSRNKFSTTRSCNSI